MQNILYLAAGLILTIFQNKSSKKDNEGGKTSKPFWRYVILGFLVYYVVKNEVYATRRKNEQDKVFSDPNAKLAFMIWGALNIKQLGGFDLPFDFVPADEEALFEYAAQIKNIEAVKSSYTLQFERDMYTDLRTELGNETFQKWLSQLGKPVNVVARINLTSFDSVTGKPVKDYKAGETVGKYIAEVSQRTTQGATTQMIVTEVSEYLGLSKKQVLVLKSAVLL